MSKQSLKEGYEKFIIRNGEDECWGWSGCAANPGYGQFRHEMKIERAHRASWIIHFGEIPKGMSILHKCDNRICSNPKHLFIGTQRDNLLDMISKGRHPVLGVHGEKNKTAILTNDQVKRIKEICLVEKSVKKVAEMFHVSIGAICGIKYNKTWRSI